MAENQQVMSRRDQQIGRLRKKYPDKKFEDDEEIYGQISDDYDNYEQQLSGYKDSEKAMSDMFSKDPRSAQFLADMHNGKSPWANYIRTFGPELKDMLDDPDTIKQIEEAEKEYVDRVAQSQKLDQEFSQNIEQTKATLKQFQSERGLSDEQIEKIMAVAFGIARDGIVGKYTADTLDMIAKAVNYDTDVANANEEGTIAGRNEKITEKLRQRSKGDGTMPLSGKNTTPGAQRPQSVFDLAQEAM